MLPNSKSCPFALSAPKKMTYHQTPHDDLPMLKGLKSALSVTETAYHASRRREKTRTIAISQR